MLSSKIKEELDQVASDKEVQMSCVRAMFQECERGTDLWETLEGDAEKYAPKTRILLWGAENEGRIEDEEDSDFYELDCLYNCEYPNQVIDYLLDTVEENIALSILGRK